MTLNLLFLALTAIVGALAAYSLSPLSARLAAVVGAVDEPGPRKVHTRPIPRLGGLAVLLGTVAGLVAVASTWLWNELSVGYMSGVLAGLLPIVAISVVDDIRPVSAWVKAGCHLVGAFVAVALGVQLAPEVTVLGREVALGWVGLPLSVFWLVGITNAFNIVDGLDGLAAGLALIAALTMTAVFASAGQWDSAMVPAALAGALIGFLPYNTHPARMFLGDSGAASIGFILGTLALKGGATTSAGFAAALPLFVMGLPIADTLVAIARRLAGRFSDSSVRVFQPDRNHIHHRLMTLGLTHQRAVLILYGAGLSVALVALLSIFMSDRHAAFLLTALLVAGVVGIQRLGYDEFAVVRRGTLLRLYRMPVLKYGFFSVLVDLCFVAASAYLAVGLRTDDWWLQTRDGMLVELVAPMAPLTVAVFWAMGLYRGKWSLAGLDDYLRVIAANVLAAAAVGIVGGWLLQVVVVPVVVIYGFISTVAFVGSRASYRILESVHHRAAGAGVPVLVCGNVPSAVAMVRYLSSFHGDGVLRPVGLLADSPDEKGKMVAGLKVLGVVTDLVRAAVNTGARGVVVAGELSESESVSVREGCEAAGLLMYRLNVGQPELDEASEPAEQAEVPEPYADQPYVGQPELEAAGVAPAAPARTLVVGVARCRKCRKWELRRSRSRGMFEQLRRQLTIKRPHRCAACGWRGWIAPENLVELWQDTGTDPSRSAPDLAALDLTAPGKDRAS